MGAIAFTFAAFVAACGSNSGTTPIPNPGPTGGHIRIRHGAFFVPVVPPFSPDSPYGAIASKASTPYAGAQNDHWFYLVNGYQLQTPVPGVPGSAPVPQTTPYVLAVNGPLPQGAPGPNGGVTAGTVSLSTAPQTNLLWKLVQVTPGSTSSSQHVFLRSAQSFLPLQPWVGQTPIPTGASVPSGTYPSLLTGFAAQAVNLDLGASSSLSPAVYMNQNTYPFTSGQTSFQQWYYDVSTATVNNANGGVLAQTCTPGANGGCVGLAGGTTGSTSRWYAYPNYLLSTVVAEPTSGPAFPQPSVTTVPGAGVTDVAGEQAAYYYISTNALSDTITSLPHCIIPGEPGYGAYNTTYGIRCDYINVNDTGFISNCVNSANATSPPSGPQPYNPSNAAQTATITAADWSVVAKQMHAECNYAQGVSLTFSSYQTVLSDIFTGASGQINPIAQQIQSTQKVKVSPLILLRGIVYSVLSLGGAESGLFANLMQTTIDYNTAHHTALQTPIAATAQSLYGQLSTMFTNNVENEGNQLEIIVWNWHKLEQVGPLTAQDGPNGLGITLADEGAMEKEGIAAYQTVLLQTFFPSAYQLSMNPGQTSTNPFKSPSYDTYAYLTFGSASGTYNVNVLCQGNGKYKNCPTQQLMAAPTPLPEQARFQLFNGMNGWSQLQRTSNSLKCENVMMNVFNGTPNLLTVRVVPNKNAGQIIAPGGGWTKNPYSAQLFPFGYVPIYAAYSVPFGGQSQLSITVNIFSGSTMVGTFTVRDGYCGVQYVRNISASNVSTASGWSFYPTPYGNAYNYPNSNLWAGTGYGGNYPGYMWVVIN